MQQTIQLPTATRSAQFRAQSFDEGSNSIDVVWTTETPVRRWSWMDDDYDETLLCDPENVRLDRLNSGAAFLDTHDSYQLSSIIGAVVPGSARMEGKQGLAKVQLSRAAGAADLVQNIKDGVIRNISVGYVIHSATRTERDGAVPLMTATDWEPVEISAVPVPADPNAQVRAVKRGAINTHPCLVTRADPGVTQEAILADAPKPGKTGTDNANDTKVADASENTDPTIGKAGDGGQDKQVDTKAPATSVNDPGDASPLGPAEMERRIAGAVERALSDERARVNVITDLAQRSGLQSYGAEHIRLGTKLQDFRDRLTDKLVDERAADGGPKGTAAIGEPTLDKTHGDQRSAGEAMARRLLGKPTKAA